MKSVSVVNQAMLDSGAHTLAFGMKMIRSGDGDISGWTEHDIPTTVTVDGSPLLLSPANAVVISSIARNAGFAVDNLEISILKFDDYMTKVDVYDGFWDSSEFFIFQYNYAAPNEAVIPWIAGTLGNFKPLFGSFNIELRDWRQYLQQDTTRITQANCDSDFGDPLTCGKNLVGLTYGAAVTSVTNEYQFTASSLAQPTGAFNDGRMIWTSGNNIGKERKIQTHATGGVLSVSMPVLRVINIGDTFTVIEGCGKTRQNCIDHGNILNFRGFDQKDSADTLSGAPEIEP